MFCEKDDRKKRLQYCTKSIFSFKVENKNKSGGFFEKRHYRKEQVMGAPVCQLIHAGSKQAGPVDDWVNLNSVVSVGCQWKVSESESESGSGNASGSGIGSGIERLRLSGLPGGRAAWRTCSSWRTALRAPLIWRTARRRRHQGSHCGSGNGCGSWRDCESASGSETESDHENETVSERSSQTGNDSST